MTYIFRNVRHFERHYTPSYANITFPLESGIRQTLFIPIYDQTYSLVGYIVRIQLRNRLKKLRE
jgi:hypothetical protein